MSVGLARARGWRLEQGAGGLEKGEWPQRDTGEEALTADDRTKDERVPEIDGESPPMRALVQRMLTVAADADVTVLILGESGTGKERVARAVHRASPRHRAPFVVVNCAGLTATLAEDELFGHVRGAFTGAIGDQPGPFERASGGTLFLDEVGDLAPDLQMKLLRALQERTVQRLGGGREVPFDVRVIAATNVDLARATAEGRFRLDLYYRLKVYELCIPPLRERGGGDVEALAQAIVRRHALRRARRAPAIEPAVVARLARHNWPGNVRELENTLECAIVAAAGEPVLRAAHLPEGFDREIGPRPAQADGLQPRSPPRVLPPAEEIRTALERHDGRRGRSADELGLSRHQLYRLMVRYTVRWPPR